MGYRYPRFQTGEKLARLRRENPAVQHGSQRRKLLSADVYAYTRVYRSNCCLAVFNRGPETAVSLESIEMPDGIYKDVLSDRAVTVKGGRIEGLTLGRDASFVISYCAPARGKRSWSRSARAWSATSRWARPPARRRRCA